MEQCKKEICTKRCIFSKSADCDFDYQENLLSYNDDLLKVVRCCVNNFYREYRVSKFANNRLRKNKNNFNLYQ
ncbi:MAG: hypothetical protein L6V88_03840 [Anaerotruncus sp.]|nr:MAG: hypothetical protein L6V88_03840 [Anaerotruncus sp.]